MQPVGELNDEEELEEEGHAGVRVALPQRGNAQKVFPGLKMFKDVNLNRQDFKPKDDISCPDN